MNEQLPTRFKKHMIFLDIYNSYIFWSNNECRALVTRTQKNKLKLNIKLNNAYAKCVWQY